MRAARGSTVTLTTDPFDGLPVTPAATVTRADGTELEDPVCAVVDHTVTVKLTAADHLNLLDELTVAITAEVDDDPVTIVETVDVIGSHWVTLAALRREPSLDNRDRYPNELLREVRDEWEAHIEELCNLRMTPGYSVEHHRIRGYGSHGAGLIDAGHPAALNWGRSAVHLDAQEPTALRLVLVNGEAVDLDDVTLGRDGVVELVSDVFPHNARVEIHVEHGLTRPPAKMVREVRKAVRREVMQRLAQTPNDAIRETSPDTGVTIQYSTPNPEQGRWTGIMSLDAAIAEYKRHEMGFA